MLPQASRNKDDLFSAVGSASFATWSGHFGYCHMDTSLYTGLLAAASLKMSVHCESANQQHLINGAFQGISPPTPPPKKNKDELEYEATRTRSRPWTMGKTRIRI